MRESSNRAISRIPKDLLIVLLVLLCSSLGFGLGMLAERQNEAEKGSGIKIAPISNSTAAVPVTALAGAAVGAFSTSEAPQGAVGQGTMPYVGSRSGKVYYLSTCKSANRIKPENRIYFASAEAAKAAGRTPAANCPGL